mmetsp:Transcript_38649/g.99247  ORF Transcript_38649/g.99247 Transcript_38649/m.99247 type:complete len:145 (-) Transcript_38649:1317-1751(-)
MSENEVSAEVMAAAEKAGISEELLKGEQRLQLELEFVLALANLDYVHHLAQLNYFKRDSFVRYLRYLMYFKQPAYAKMIVYPQALQILELLQHETFRGWMSIPAKVAEMKQQQQVHWQHHREDTVMMSMGMQAEVTSIDMQHSA